MITLSEIIGRIRSLDVSEAAQQRQVDALMEPVRELERLQREKAEALARQKAIEAEIAQLEAEIDDDERWLTSVTANEATIAACASGLAELERLLSSGVPIGQTLTFDHFTVNRLWFQVNNVVTSEIPSRRARMAEKQARVKALRGKK